MPQGIKILNKNEVFKVVNQRRIDKGGNFNIKEIWQQFKIYELGKKLNDLTSLAPGA
jgi:hypothetical protein